MSLRILGGAFKGRALKAPKGSSTRPTLAIVRKAVFDICQHQTTEATFLDVFAGSGGMGLEALSRGASEALFIENHPLAIEALTDNIQTLGVQKKAHLLKISVFLALQTLLKQQKTFDIVYIDPPYTSDVKLLTKTLLFFDQHPLIRDQGILFFEEGAPGTLMQQSFTLGSLKHISSRQLGQSLVHEFWKQSS